MTRSFTITAVKREGGKLRQKIREAQTPAELQKFTSELKKAGWRVTPRRVNGNY